MKTRFLVPWVGFSAAVAALPITSASDGPPGLPAEILADVRALYDEKDTGKTLPAQARLRAVLKKPGDTGEHLAQHILNIIAEDERPPNLMFHLLDARAYTFDEKRNIVPHLDGPYLKRLARMSVPDDANQRKIRDHYAAVAYLKLHPEGHELYWRLRLAATRDAKVSRLPKENFRLEKDDPPHLEKIREYVRSHYPEPVVAYSLRDAWEILLQLGVLRPGMTVDEAEKILGERYRKEDDPEIKNGFIRWYHNTPRHVNPNLNAEVKDGKIVSFRSGNA